MAITAATLQAVVEVHGVNQAVRELGQFSARVNEAGQSAAKSGSVLGGLNKALGSVQLSSVAAAAGIAGIGAAATAAGKAAVRAGIDYEQAFAGVRKTVDATKQEFDSLSRGIRDMAKSIPVTATEIARIAEAAGQLGIETDNVLSFTRVMADLGVATNMSSDQAAMALARLANITGMAQTDFDRLGSSVTALGNSLAATESEIVEMGLRIAGAGKQIGLTEAEILAFAGALASVGIEAQAGGSAISRVMVRLASDVATGAESLDMFASVAGMTVSEFKTLFQDDAATAVMTFIEGLNAVAESGGNVFGVLEELGLTEIRVRDALLRSAGAGDVLRNAINLSNDAWEENIALTREAELFYGTAANKIQTAKNRLNDVALELYDAYQPAMSEAINITSDLIEEIGKIPRVVNIAVNFIRGPEGLPEDQLPTSFEMGGVTIPVHFAAPEAGRASGLWDIVKVPLEITTGVKQMSLLGDAIVYVDESVRSMNEGMTPQQVMEYATAVERAIAIVQDAGGEVNDAGEFLPLYTEEDLKWIREVTVEAEKAANQWFNTAEAQSTATFGSRELAKANEYQLAVLHDLESGHGAYAGQLSTVERLQHDAALANWKLAETFNDLHTAYGQNLSDMAAFGSQASEYSNAQSAIEKAYERIHEKVEDGIELSETEQLVYDHGLQAMERYAGGIEDAENQQALYAIAAEKVMEAQDELNKAIADGEEDLGPYQQKLDDAKGFLGEVEEATGRTSEAQETLSDVIQNDLIGSINDLTRKIEYISKPWLIEIDAATEAAERELARIEGILDRINSKMIAPTGGLWTEPGSGSGPGAYASGGTIPAGGELAWVGEEGPELMLLPGGAHIYPHDESMDIWRKLLGDMPGYASGTDGRPQLTDADRAAIRILGDLEVVLDPQSVADAEAELQALWDARRIAEELGLGEAVIAELDQQIKAKQGELDLIGRVAGTAFGEGVLAELEAVAASERFTGIFQLPSAPGSYSLDDIISGEAQKKIQEEFQELWRMQQIAQDLGMDEWAAEIGQQMKELGLDEEFINSVINTETGQRLAEKFKAEQIAEKIGERFDAVFAGPRAAENLMGQIEELSDKITLGLAKGVPASVIAEWEKEKAELEQEAGFYWYDVALAAAEGLIEPEAMAAFAEAGGEQFKMYLETLVGPAAAEELLSGITAITDAGFEQLMEIFGQGEEIAGQFMDDIVLGLLDGTFDYEQAMALLSQVGSESLIPMLEQIEQQLTVDLVNAIIAGNAELEADILEKLRLLGILQEEIKATAKAVSDSAHPNIRHGGSVTPTGGARGGGSRGGGGGTWIGGSGGRSGGGPGYSDESPLAGPSSYPHLAGQGAIPAGDPRHPGGWAGGITPTGHKTPNKDGIATFQDAVDHYLQTGDASMLGKYALGYYSGSAGSHGGDIAGYIADLVARRADPQHGAKTGNKVIAGIASLMQQHPELWDDPAFWQALAASLEGYTFGDTVGIGPAVTASDALRLAATLKGLVYAHITGQGYVDPNTGLFTHGPDIANTRGLSDFEQHVEAMDQQDKLMRAVELGIKNDTRGLSPSNKKKAQKIIDARKAEQGTSDPEPKPRVSFFADGGVIDRPLLALVGEAGPEIVQPLSSGHPERERFISDIADRVGGGMNSEKFDRLLTLLEELAKAPYVIDGQVVAAIERSTSSRVMHTMPTKAGL